MKTNEPQNLINTLVKTKNLNEQDTEKLENFIKSKIPLRFKDANLINTNKIIQDYYNNDVFKEKSLYLYGGCGVGKTYSIYALAIYLMVNKYSLCIFNLIDLLNKIRLSYNREKSYIEKLYDVEFLIIDDIGKEKVSEWVSEQLYSLINHRYENMKTTIFTSNLTLNELSEKAGYESIVSRIAEMCEVYELTGQDRRLNKKL